MVTVTQETHLDLAAGDRIDLIDMRERLLACESGKVKLMQDDAGGLHALGAGTSWRIASNAAVRIVAIEAASLRLTHRQVLAATAAASGSPPAWRREVHVSPLAALSSLLIR